jgi:hypothetical protein
MCAASPLARASSITFSTGKGAGITGHGTARMIRAGAA